MITMDASAVKVDSAGQYASDGDTEINKLLENANSFPSHTPAQTSSLHVSSVLRVKPKGFLKSMPLRNVAN